MDYKDFLKDKMHFSIIILIFLGAAAFFVLDKMSDSVILAREAKYVSYVSQMKNIVEKANTLSAFEKISSSQWVCLGNYTDFCWGSKNSEIKNDEIVDRALSSLETLPSGQFSPYNEIYQRGTLIKINPKSIDIKVYIGNKNRVEAACRQLNMVVDDEDSLSCRLSGPIVKN